MFYVLRCKEVFKYESFETCHRRSKLESSHLRLSAAQVSTVRSMQDSQRSADVLMEYIASDG